MSVIELFLIFFQSGEVWIEIVKELELENVEPLKDDKAVCDALLQRVKECCQLNMQFQLKLIESQKNMDALDEQELYAEVRESVCITGIKPLITLHQYLWERHKSTPPCVFSHCYIF